MDSSENNFSICELHDDIQDITTVVNKVPIGAYIINNYIVSKNKENHQSEVELGLTKPVAECAREYRQRQKLLNASKSSAHSQKNTIKQRKTSTQRVREYRARQKLLQTSQSPFETLKPTKQKIAPAECFRDYRQCQKLQTSKSSVDNQRSAIKHVKTSAERARDYRERRKLFTASNPTKIENHISTIKLRKTSTQRSREFRARQKLLEASKSPADNQQCAVKQKKTSAQRGREYRERQKLLQKSKPSNDNQHGTTNQINTPAQRHRDYRQRLKRQADESISDHQRLPTNVEEKAKGFRVIPEINLVKNAVLCSLNLKPEGCLTEAPKKLKPEVVTSMCPKQQPTASLSEEHNRFQSIISQTDIKQEYGEIKIEHDEDSRQLLSNDTIQVHERLLFNLKEENVDIKSEIEIDESPLFLSPSTNVLALPSIKPCTQVLSRGSDVLANRMPYEDEQGRLPAPFEQAGEENKKVSHYFICSEGEELDHGSERSQDSNNEEELGSSGEETLLSDQGDPKEKEMNKLRKKCAVQRKIIKQLNAQVLRQNDQIALLRNCYENLLNKKNMGPNSNDQPQKPNHMYVLVVNPLSGS